MNKNNLCDDAKDIGERVLKEARLQEFSRKEFCDIVNISSDKLFAIKKGEYYPTAREIDMICVTLRKPLSWITQGSIDSMEKYYAKKREHIDVERNIKHCDIKCCREVSR